MSHLHLWPLGVAVYLHRAPVDFRKQINGLAVPVSESMQLDPFAPALYVFVNGARNLLDIGAGSIDWVLTAAASPPQWVPEIDRLAGACSGGLCTNDFTQFMYDWWPGYKFGTLIYNTTLGDGSWTGWEALDATSVVGLGAGRGIQIFQAARAVTNRVPRELARVVPGSRSVTTLGRAGEADVLVTAADDIAGLNASQLAQRLTVSPAETFTVIRFPTPAGGGGIASPVFRANEGFLHGGLTRGGAREFVVPNGTIPPSAVIEVVR